MTLAEQARSILEQALEAYRDTPRAANWLHRHLVRFDEPLRLAVVGPASSGKSTLVNALVGEQIAPDGAEGPSWYRARLSRSQGEVTLIDTPGLEENASPQAVQAAVTDADAVLFLARQPRNANLRELRFVHGHPIAMVHPVNSLVVLSRADELGAGRVDALISARQLARRYRRDPEVRDVCQDVVAVAGQVASAGRTLTEPEFAALSALAGLPRPESEALLLSADRFVRAESGPVEASARAGLLRRFGLFGLRLATTLLRRESGTVAALAAQLVQRSGLAELRDAIGQHFTERAEVLKARSALIGLEVLLRREPHPGGEALFLELDRVLAGAHEFRELRLLAALRTDGSALPEPLREDASRLLGGHGTAALARLGIESELDYHRAARDAVRRWRELTGNPVLSAEGRQAAAVVLRSCEAMAAPVAN
ncbi:dynamin family protein [Amycolatopsis anabasis]|uniref:dynamin family protein n=1 Tax=Amycolatopsis anabasis TaxID=1840409 RepID=UPI00131DF8C6|nr:GTPase domain-containing protein [Amycolatopsis anabasis]